MTDWLRFSNPTRTHVPQAELDLTVAQRESLLHHVGVPSFHDTTGDKRFPSRRTEASLVKLGLLRLRAGRAELTDAGMGEARREMREHVWGLSRRSHDAALRSTLALLQDSYGGDDWEGVTIEHLRNWGGADTIPQDLANEMIEQGFDPRHLL